MTLNDYFDFVSSDDIRLQGHRIGIDTILEPFLNGYAPEAIATDYPELSMEKIYATLTYYFRHQREVDAYLQRLSQRRERRCREALRQPSPIAKRLRALKQPRRAVTGKP